MIKPRIIIVIMLIAIFIWTMFTPPKILQDFKDNLTNIARFPLKAVSTFLNSVDKISRLSYVDSEKLELRHRVYKLERELAEFEEVSLENKRLRKLIGFKDSGRESSIPAVVIGRDPNTWSSVVIIDKGRDDGIVRDMVVTSSRGLVGRVIEAGKALSKVMLINDIDSKVGAILQKSREQALLVGTPRGRCRLIYLSLEADVNRGDKVLTSGMGGVYPKGILIGEIIDVAKEKGRLYKYAIVNPSNELPKLEEVLCIK